MRRRGSLYYSHRRRKDGLLRLLFGSAYRCYACGHRHHRINPVALAKTAAVLLLLALFVGVGEIVSMHQEPQQAPPHASTQGVIGNA
jgi:hypothetical protein